MNFKVVIIGAGSGGISTAARLIREMPSLKEKMAILDPSETHYYQPLWTLAGAGEIKKEATEREQRALIPEGVKWIKESAARFEPEVNQVVTLEGTVLQYDYLVVAAGIQINWNKIKGLKDSIGKSGVCSNYSYEYVNSTWASIQNFKGGTAIFTHPNTPIKCGGAPQKIMYLADEVFRKNGVRDNSKILFATASDTIFAVKKYADTLEEVIERKGIITNYQKNLIEIDSGSKTAIFEHTLTGEKEVIGYDMIHVVPPMGAPDFIAQSPLSDSNGWVDVDPFTLRHNRYSNVFGLGDCSNLPTSKTGAAIRKQAPVVAGNIINLLQGKQAGCRYNGYTSCPLITGYNSLVLAEFIYGNEPAETFPFDQSKERFSMYVMKKSFLPIMYWNGMLKGIM